jgi:3-methyladenine DNA glycosylase Mpg
MPAAAPIPGRPGAGSGPASSGVPPGIQPFRRLRRSELPVDTASLARYLIGKILVHEAPRRMSGRIVESEAYVVGDAAAHSHRGMTSTGTPMSISYMETGTR